MIFLSAIINLSVYLHHAVTGATLHVNNVSLPIADQAAGSFVSARFDVGDAQTMAYGCDADGFAIEGSAWRVLPGDEWVTTVALNGNGFGGFSVNDPAGGQEYAWMQAVVLPEPSGALVALVSAGLVLGMAMKRGNNHA